MVAMVILNFYDEIKSSIVKPFPTLELPLLCLIEFGSRPAFVSVISASHDQSLQLIKKRIQSFNGGEFIPHRLLSLDQDIHIGIHHLYAKVLRHSLALTRYCKSSALISGNQ